MSEYRFTDQIATENILLRVTNVCGECFCDLRESDTIYYDNDKYQYICEKCAQRIKEEMRIEEEVEEDGGEAVLFG